MFGELVRAHRRRLGLTQEELAGVTGVNVRTVGKLEAGQISSPRPSTVRLLADAFTLAGADRERFFGSAAEMGEESPVVPVARWSVPTQLPADARGFTGRAEHLDQLTALCGEGRPGPVLAVIGTAGVGKTALAVHWGHRVRDRFPDGQLYVNLRGYSAGRPVQPAEALGRFLRALDVAAEKIPTEVEEAAALYRSVLADRRVLVVLDNVRNADQVRPLLPGHPGCVVLITSREQLDALVAVDGARRLDLDMLPLSDAIALLSYLIGEDRVRAEPAAAADLAAACACLPLALRITAAQLLGRPRRLLAEQVVALRAGDRLAELAVDDDPTASVAAALDLSYQTLPADAARLFRLFGLSPAPDLGPAALAAMAGLADADAAPLLAILRAAHLITEPAQDRFGMHDLVRLYAARHAQADESAQHRQEAIDRLLDWYADAAVRGNLALAPLWRAPEWTVSYPPANPQPLDSDQAAMDWFDRESGSLQAMVRFASDNDVPRVVLPLVQGQVTYLLRGHLAQTMVELSRLGFAAAEIVDEDVARAAHAVSLGIGYSLLRQPIEAVAWYERARDLNEKLGDLGRVARTHVNLGAIYSEVGQLDEAVRHLRAALEISRATGERAAEVAALGNLGHVYQLMGNWELANATLLTALAFQQAIGDRHGECLAEGNLGSAYAEQGNYPEAAKHLEAGLKLALELGDQVSVARVRLSLGDVQQALGTIGTARMQWQAALAIFVDLEHPEAEDVQTRLRNSMRSADRPM